MPPALCRWHFSNCCLLPLNRTGRGQKESPLAEAPLLSEIRHCLLQSIFKGAFPDGHGGGEHQVDGIIKVFRIAAAGIPIFMRWSQIGDPIDHAAGVSHIAVESFPQLKRHAALEGGVAVRPPAMEIIEIGQKDIAVPHVLLQKNAVGIDVGIVTVSRRTTGDGVRRRHDVQTALPAVAVVPLRSG